MPTTISSSPLMLPAPPQEEPRVELRCYSYEDRFSIMAAMLETLDHCGCWVESRHPFSPTQVEVRFLAQLSTVDELYSGLVAAGVEMTRDSHQALTWLCTRRRHETGDAYVTVSVRMEMNFLELPDLEMGIIAQGLA